MITVAIAGKFDPIHEGHIDHIVKAAKLGDYLYIITHPDNVVASHCSKGFCAIPLRARVSILEAIMRYHEIKGEVVVSNSPDGTSAEALCRLKPDIFAKGGDRTASNMPQNEISVCQEIGCHIVYGVGDLLNSSSKLMFDVKKEFMPNWVLRKSNEQYDIYDSHIMNTVVSITYLKPHQSTNGHQHPHPELYVYLEGKTRIKIGEHYEGKIGFGGCYSIPPEAFHQVFNENDKASIFLSIWNGGDKS